MRVIEELLQSVQLPNMLSVRQDFARPQLSDVHEAVRESFAGASSSIRWPVLDMMRGKQESFERHAGDGERHTSAVMGLRGDTASHMGTIAVVVGSRGVAQIAAITKAVVAELKSRGYSPFIVPGMGSHGGATAEGQREVLASLGVTEEAVGAPIQSSMEVVGLGTLANGLPVYMDKEAYQADGIVVINRIKPHTAFRGDYESGLVKMIAIGLGKQKGADACHRLGFGMMASQIVEMAKVSLGSGKILAGVAVLENAYDEVAEIQVVPAAQILDAEPGLLRRAKANMPRILVDEFDVLVVDEIGKDISGDGMDPNITGRYPTPYASGGPRVTRICVLGLTSRSHGNANGIGLADMTTRRAFEAMDLDVTYPNALTSTVFDPVKIPMVLDNDRLAIQAAVKTANVLRQEDVRVVHIRTTLAMDVIRVSTSLETEIRQRSDANVLSDAAPWTFDAFGNLNMAQTWA